MTPEEREQLIQRFYDGETIGNEQAQALALLDADADARALLESLQGLTDSVRLDVDEVVAAEDFSDFWSGVQARLPQGPLTLEQGEPDVVRSPARPLREGSRARWWMWLAAPLAAAALVFVALSPGGTRTPSDVVASNAIVIEDLESAGGSVMVQQESDEVPAIIWFVEGDPA